MLNNYNISGYNAMNRRVNESVQALNEKHALSMIHQNHGELTVLDISQTSFLDKPIEVIPEVKKYYTPSRYQDNEIIDMLDAIRTDQGSQSDYKAVKEHFTPILTAAVEDYRYNDLTATEQEDYKELLLLDIVNEFGPKFSAQRGRLLSFMKLKIRDRMHIYYNRRTNVNSNNKEKRRPRSEALKEYFETSNLPPQDIDLDEARMNLARVIQQIGDTKFTGVPRRVIEDMHERIVDLELHHLLNLKKQKHVYALAYGPKRLKQRDIAVLLNTSQPNVSVTLKRAKKNIWKKIMKLNVQAD